MTRTRYQLDTRVLTLFLLVTMPFIAFGSFMVVNMARTALQDAVGRSLEQHAVETAIQVERYVGGHLLHLQWLASSPEVQGVLATSGTARAPDVKQLEEAWVAGEPQLLASVSRTPVADRLREMSRLYPALRLVQVVDASGRLVATSSRGGRVWNADAPWFRALAQDETGLRPYVGDVQPASRSGLPGLELAYPVRRASDQSWLGGVRIVLDAADLDSVLAPVRVGRTGHAVLLRARDGMILGSDVPSQVLKESFPGFPYVQAARNERQGYWAMPEIRSGAAAGGARIEPPRIVGLGAANPVAGIEWIVAVEQDLDEALAPVEQVVRYLWIHFAGALGTAVLLAFYVSFKLEKPVIEEELHLHPEHVPSRAA